MLIATGARASEGATKVAIVVSAVITVERVSEFEEFVAEVAALGEALAMTRPY